MLPGACAGRPRAAAGRTAGSGGTRQRKGPALAPGLHASARSRTDDSDQPFAPPRYCCIRSRIFCRNDSACAIRFCSRSRTTAFCSGAERLVQAQPFVADLVARVAGLLLDVVGDLRDGFEIRLRLRELRLHRVPDLLVGSAGRFARGLRVGNGRIEHLLLHRVEVELRLRALDQVTDHLVARADAGRAGRRDRSGGDRHSRGRGTASRLRDRNARAHDHRQRGHACQSDPAQVALHRHLVSFR